VSDLLREISADIAPHGEEAPQPEDEHRDIEFRRVLPFGRFARQVPPSGIGSDYLTAGLAAAFTARIDNPIFKLPTEEDERSGAIPAAFATYAPYYVGTGLSPEQIANDVAMQAALFLKTLDAQHGHDGYVGRMLSVLRSGRVAQHGLQAIEDRNILLDIHDFMFTIINRLRHVALLNASEAHPYSAANAYRAATHDKVDPYAKTVVYQPTPDGYSERFALPDFTRSDPAGLVALGWDFFDSKSLRTGAEFAALAAEKVGDPLIRYALSEHYIPPYMRTRDYLLAAR
jgi:hypothetical protein